MATSEALNEFEKMKRDNQLGKIFDDEDEDDDENVGDFVDRLKDFRNIGRGSAIVRDSKYAKQQRIAAYDSSEKNLTDIEFYDNAGIDSEEIELYLQTPISMRNPENIPDLSDCHKKLLQ